MIFVNWRAYILIGLELVTLIYTIHVLKNIEPADSLSESIALYRASAIDPIKKLTLPNLPQLLRLLREVSDALGYFSAFIVVRQFVLTKKIEKNFIVVFILCLVNSIMLGYRTVAFSIILSVAVYVYCIFRAKIQWRSKSNLKIIGIIIIFAVVLILIFQLFASALGRNVTDYSMLDYLSIYLGAEIKNLDVFLQNGMFPVHNGTFGSQTFVNLGSSVRRILGLKAIKTVDLPFLSVGHYNLGNVYTTFYAFVYDFGYTGFIILTALMAWISQSVFEKVRRLSISNNNVSIAVLIYGKIAVALLLSFFSNKFYEDIFSIVFLRTVIYWAIFNMFLYKGSKKIT